MSDPVINYPQIEEGSTLARMVRELIDCQEDDRSLMIPRLRRMMVLFCQAHFADAHNFGEYAEQMGCLIFKPQDPNSPVIIQATHVYVPGVEENRRPGVHVEIQRSGSRKWVLGDHAGRSDDTSEQTLSRKKVIDIRIHCEAPDFDIAAIMADTLADFFEAVKEKLMRNLQLLEFDVLGTEPFKKAASPMPEGWFAWTLGIRLSHDHQVFSQTESHRLKTWVTQVCMKDNG